MSAPVLGLPSALASLKRDVPSLTDRELQRTSQQHLLLRRGTKTAQVSLQIPSRLKFRKNSHRRNTLLLLGFTAAPHPGRGVCYIGWCEITFHQGESIRLQTHSCRSLHLRPSNGAQLIVRLAYSWCFLSLMLNCSKWNSAATVGPLAALLAEAYDDKRTVSQLYYCKTMRRNSFSRSVARQLAEGHVPSSPDEGLPKKASKTFIDTGTRGKSDEIACKYFHFHCYRWKRRVVFGRLEVPQQQNVNGYDENLNTPA